MKKELYNLILTIIKRIRGYPLELIDANLSTLMQEYDRRLPSRVKPLETTQKILSETVPYLRMLKDAQQGEDKNYEVASYLVGHNCLEIVEQELLDVDNRSFLIPIGLEKKIKLQQRLEECSISILQVEKLISPEFSLKDNLCSIKAFEEQVRNKISTL